MNEMSDDDRRELEKARETMKGLNWFAWIVMVLFLCILGGAMMCNRAFDEDPKTGDTLGTSDVNTTETYGGGPR